MGAVMATEAPEKTTEQDTTTQTQQDAKPLDFAAAGDILDKAGGEHPESRGNALADSEEADALADSAETDALESGAADDLDSVLADDPDSDAATDDTVSGGEQDEPDAATARDYSKLPPRIAAIMRHVDAAGVSYEEAEAAIFGTAKGEESEAQTEEAKPFDFTAAEAELADLRTKRRAASADFTNPAKTIELTELIEAKQLVLATERAKEQLQAAEAARERRTSEGQRQTKQAEAVADMGAKFPDAFKPGTKLHDAILTDSTKLLQSNPAFFNDPDWVETLVRKHASRLGIVEKKPGASASASPAATAARTAPKPKLNARPLPAPGGRSATQQTSEAEISKAIQEAKARGDAATLDHILNTGTLPAKTT